MEVIQNVKGFELQSIQRSVKGSNWNLVHITDDWEISNQYFATSVNPCWPVRKEHLLFHRSFKVGKTPWIRVELSWMNICFGYIPLRKKTTNTLTWVWNWRAFLQIFIYSPNRTRMLFVNDCQENLWGLCFFNDKRFLFKREIKNVTRILSKISLPYWISCMWCDLWSRWEILGGQKVLIQVLKAGWLKKVLSHLCLRTTCIA